MVLGTDLEAQGTELRKGLHHFFHGNDPDSWASNAQSFRKVSYSDLFPGIDMELYFYGGQLKYDLIVHPGADWRDIEINYKGLNPELEESGNLLLPNKVNTIQEMRPYSYQIKDHKEIEVESNYRLEDGQLSFHIGAHDESRDLIIDPILKFSTYSGSTANNFGYTATYDQAGFLYSGSSVFSPGQYPTTEGAYDLEFNGGSVDYAISKFDTTGTFLIYSTYIGGSANELPHSIIVNEQDELYVFGTTGSDDYPTLSTSYDQTFAGGTALDFGSFGLQHDDGTDIFLTKLSHLGDQLLGSTYIGGTKNDGVNTASGTTFNYADELRGEIELDAEGNILVATCTQSNETTDGFPISSNAFQNSYNGGSQDGLILKMDAGLQDMVWSSYFGGTSDDVAFSILENEQGELVVAGSTNSTDLPASPDALFNSFQGGDSDGWTAVIDNSGIEINACSYWGTDSYDQVFMCEIDGQGNIHLLGQTMNGDELIINADYSVANSGQFISKLNPTLDQVIWSTAFGSGDGDPDFSPTAFLVDLCDRIYLSGWGGPTGSAGLGTVGLPLTSDAFQTTTDGGDFYLMSLADDASELVYGSFYGGNQSNEHVDGGTSRFDRKGKVYQAVCAGCQGNSDFPIAPTDAHSPENGSGGCNLGVFKMDFELPVVVADFLSPPACLPDSTQFINTSLGGSTFQWSFGDGNTSSLPSPSHLYAEPGLYEVTLIISDPLTCNLSDTLSQEIFIFSGNGASLEEQEACPGDTVQLGFPPLPVAGLTYSWSPPQFLDDANISAPSAIIESTTEFTLTIDNGVCPTSSTQFVDVEDLDLSISPDTVICDGDALTLSGSTSGQADFYTWSSNPNFLDTLSTDSTLNVTPLFGTQYYLAAEKNCRYTQEVYVGLFTEYLSLSPDQYICAENIIDLSLSNTLATLDQTISWEPESAILSGQGSPDISVMTDSDLWMNVHVENAEGCVYQDSIHIGVSPLSFLQADATALPNSIPQGGESQLNASPIGGYSYEWTPSNDLNLPNSSNPIASPDETTIYHVTVRDSNPLGSCAKSDTVIVSVFEISCGFPSTYLPNAFTPNGDGQNDILYLRSSYVSEFHLKIYDRWGELVFESRDKKDGWDGTYRGKRLDPAVFVYHLDITCIDGARNLEKGNISLIR